MAWETIVVGLLAVGAILFFARGGG